MMKRTVCALLILTCSNAYSATWSATPPATREALISGYVGGFMSGYSYGISEGITTTKAELTTSDAKVSPVKTIDVYDYCSSYVASNFDRIYDIALQGNSIANEGTGHYVSEIDSFLKSYPRCGKMQVMELVEVLAPVWFSRTAKKITYKDVGEGCGAAQ